MPRNALGHALGQNNFENFELLRGFITIQGIVPGPEEWILSRGGPNTMNGAGQTEIPEFTL